MQVKPIDQFRSRKSRSTGKVNRSSSGVVSRCKSCLNDAHRQYVKENTERLSEYSRQWIQSHPEVLRARHLKYNFRLTPEDYDRMLIAQNSACAVCGTGVPGGKGKVFHIDHDRSCCPGVKSCGKCIRGLLCSPCNVTLGQVKDNPDHLRKLADYLDKSRYGG